MVENFTVLLDKGLPAEVTLAAWCPTMDLLAYLTVEGQVCCHRLNWQRLWAVAQLDAAVTAMCWHPEAQVLATGHADGTINLLSAENGDLLLAAGMANAAVTSISWLEEDTATADAIGSVVGDEAPQAQEAGGNGPSMFLPSERHAAQQPPIHATLMVIADAAGMVHLATYGLFVLARVSLKASAPPDSRDLQPPRMLKALASRDLRHMYVIWQAETGCSLVGSNLSVFDIAKLGQWRGELRHLASAASQTLALLASCQKVLACVEKGWREAMTAVQERKAALRQLLLDFKDANQLDECEQFRRLLARGAPDPALMHFLCSTLGESGLKSLAKQVDGAANLVAQALVEELQPMIHDLVLLLAKLRGLSLCHSSFAPLGLEDSSMQQAESRVAFLLQSCEQARIMACQAPAQWRAFFAWLLQTLRRLNDDSHSQPKSGLPTSNNQLATFLRTHLRQDPLLPLLQSEKEAGAAVAGSLAEQRSCSLWQLLGRYPLPVGNLRTQLDELREACSLAFSRVPCMLLPSLQPLLSIPLPHSVGDSHPSPTISAPQVRGEESSTHVLVSCVVNNSRPALLLLRLQPQPQPSTTAREVGVALLQLPSNTVVVDVASYKQDGTLALLLQTDGRKPQASAASLVLLPAQDLSFQNLPQPAGKWVDLKDVGKAAEQQLDAVDGIRQRSLGQGVWRGPLAVSGPRGVACVLSTSQRVLLLDLVEDEETDILSD